jgi:hypothetical protein
MGGACRTSGGEEEHVYVISGEPEGKRPVERTRCRWMDNVKIDLGEIGWGGLDWIGLAQDWESQKALVKAAKNLWVP